MVIIYSVDCDALRKWSSLFVLLPYAHLCRFFLENAIFETLGKAKKVRIKLLYSLGDYVNVERLLQVLLEQKYLYVL